MNMNKWKKEDGTILECNDNKETNECCKRLGWEQIEGRQPKDEPGDVKPGKGKGKKGHAEETDNQQ